jgi:hypothetical protein
MRMTKWRIKLLKFERWLDHYNHILEFIRTLGTVLVFLKVFNII